MQVWGKGRRIVMATEERGSGGWTLKTQLQGVVLHLEHAQSAVAVAVAALRQQSCELDEDIAAVLQCSVADLLHDEIEKLEAAVRELTQLELKH
jgi:hypothetical protein